MILKTHNLKKHFGGIYATNDLSLSFEKGKIYGLIGPNGSGKSTFINILSGLVKMDSGLVEVSGEKFKKILPHEIANVGITRTFQEVRLFEQLSVMDNILVALTERHLFSAIFERHKAHHLAKANEVLEKVGLLEKKDEKAKNLSYGQRKLLEVGRVLAMKYAPTEGIEIIFFDEPFAGLFPQMREIIKTIMKELRASGKTLILVEHNMDIIRELSDDIIVLDEGKLIAEGKPIEVLNNKKVLEAYLGE